jgi:predicted negative regulator of RcsB-dependent stress response
MTRIAVALVLLLGAGGCAYYNSLYNANRAFDEAEDARREGRESTARAKYAEAIEKAAKSYRDSGEGRWADDALYLIGRAHARRADWLEAQAALDAALAVSTDSQLRSGARVFLGAAAVSLGEEDAGMGLLDAALAEVEDEATRAEAFLWRARAGFAAGDLEQVWADLDSAAVGGDRYRVEAALDRLSWAVDAGAPDEAVRGARTLTGSRRAAPAKDTVTVLVRAAWSRWGAEGAGPLLVGVEDAPWPPADRERLLLLRAEIAAAGGDTVTALADARTVASGVGPSADEGRVLLARWELGAVTEPAELEGVRDMLLPAVGSTEAVALLDGIKKVGLMVERSGRRGQELALFGAAELARDTLQAPLLARTLFLAYADLQAGSAWEGKALLAALALTPTEAGRGEVLSRLEAIPDNVYAAAARWELGDRQAEFTVLERRLQGLLGTIGAQIAAEAQTRDVLVAEAVRTLDSIRTTEAIARRLAEGDSTVLDSLRQDSVRLDSVRLDSIRGSSGLDSLFADTLGRDTFPPMVEANGRRGPARPLIRRLRASSQTDPGPRSPVFPQGAENR